MKLLLISALLLLCIVDYSHQCRPGVSWHNGCNFCRCVRDRRGRVGAECSERACEMDGRFVTCTPLTRWYDGCNWCECGMDGRSTMCTERGCDLTTSPDMTSQRIRPNRNRNRNRGGANQGRRRDSFSNQRRRIRPFHPDRMGHGDGGGIGANNQRSRSGHENREHGMAVQNN